MYIVIAVSVFLFISTYFLFNSRSKLNEVSLKHSTLQKIYEPAALEEKKLLEISDEYSELQSNYRTKLVELRQSEIRLSQYYLGVGTTDSVAYINLISSEDVDDIELRLADVKDSLKRLVSSKEACVCRMGNDVVVNGRRSEAKKLINREIKLRLRCLDNEFKAAAAMVDWNNINRFIDRARDKFNEINRSGTIVETYLKSEYLELKIEELRLSYELSQAKQDIKEYERAEAQLKREAEREDKRIQSAALNAEKERKLMEKLVAEELAKLESGAEEQKALYELHKQQLNELIEKEKRAISLAQTTRAGYVYIISNKASFGGDVVKIGMTRRANPNERVKELGDASVPELFDVHAFVFTDDAPTLEKYLHNKFAGQCVNMVNGRKEFFYADPNDVLRELSDYDGKFELEVFKEAS